jgi:hypothetical protein
MLSGSDPGLALNILAFGAALAFILCRIGLGRYERAVSQLMKLDTRKERKAPVPVKEISAVSEYLDFGGAGGGEPELLCKVLAGRRQLANVYAAAGVCCALVLTLAFLREVGRISFWLLVCFLSVYIWPVVLTLRYLLGSSWERRRGAEVLYLCSLLALGLIAQLYSPRFDIVQMSLLFLLINGPPTILTVAFSNRRVRAIGPTVLPFSLMAIAGVLVPLHIGAANIESVISTILLVILVIAPLGWFLVGSTSRRYEARQLSDQSLLLDSVWLLFVIWNGILIGTPVAGAFGYGMFVVAAAFPIYLVIRTLGFRWLRNREGVSVAGKSLLILRVFALGSRAEQVFDPITTLWRYAGDVRLIGGPDLAASAVQPHRFFDFINHRLRSRFIDSHETLDSRVSDLEKPPDPDGRFRVNEFFCYDSTWRLVVSRLIRQSDVILADLRGLTKDSHGGCEFEIRQVMNTFPIHRFVILIDGTTRKEHLAGILKDAWNNLPPDSPNFHARIHPIRVVDYRARGNTSISPMLHAIFAAAASC